MEVGNVRKPVLLALLLAVLAVALSGCAKEESAERSIPQATATVRPNVTVTPEPQLSNAPAPVYDGVSTDQRVVSVIFEGYTDEETMYQLIEAVSSRGVDAAFFVSGITASEHPDMVRAIVQAGLQIGNYTVSAEKEMEKNAVDVNLQQFTLAQQLIEQYSGVLPTLIRCNGTQYTQNVLKAVAASGLEAAVEPGLYLNHRSFTTEQDAQRYVSNLVRGEIISIKLGQELDLDEYGDAGEKLEERPAIDPPPTITKDTLDTKDWTYENILNVVPWLLDALEAGGYTIVSPQDLQGYEMNLFNQRRALSEQEQEVLDSTQYTLPVTQSPIGTTSTHAGTMADFEGAVFVGDAVLGSIGDYVAYRRLTEPEYMGEAQFLTTANITVESALEPVSSTSVHPVYNGEKMTIEDALSQMGAKKVYLMLRFSNTQAYAKDTYLKNLELLIYLIKEKNPGIEVVVLSQLPGIGGRTSTPTNMQLFRLNLMTCQMCMERGIPYLDVAYAMRDANGDLPVSYCMDPDMSGLYLNDKGCDVWLNYIVGHIP